MTPAIRIRFRPRRGAESTTPMAASPDDAIVQRDDGLWSLGWHDDAAGPFESRAFAEAVAAKVVAAA